MVNDEKNDKWREVLIWIVAAGLVFLSVLLVFESDDGSETDEDEDTGKDDADDGD